MEKKITFLSLFLLSAMAFTMVFKPAIKLAELPNIPTSVVHEPTSVTTKSKSVSQETAVVLNSLTQGVSVLGDKTLAVLANAIAGFNEGKIDFLVTVLTTVCDAESVRYDAANKQFIVVLKSADDMKSAPEQVNQYLAVCQKSVELLNKAKQDYINSNFGEKLSNEEINQIKKEHGANWVAKATEIAKTR